MSYTKGRGGAPRDADARIAGSFTTAHVVEGEAELEAFSEEHGVGWNVEAQGQPQAQLLQACSSHRLVKGAPADLL